MGSAIIGSGKSVPALEVPNAALERLVDTNDEWIVTRTGIQSRHIACSETATDLAEAAACAALGLSAASSAVAVGEGWCAHQTKPHDIDLLIVATFTPDTLVPSAACVLKQRLGLSNAMAFDLNAACSGFLYAVMVAENMMAASRPATSGARGRQEIRRALIVGAERLSRVTNWSDRGTCILFGDGAGAIVLESDPTRPGIISSFAANEDDDDHALSCPADYAAPFPFYEEYGAEEEKRTCDEVLREESAERERRVNSKVSEESTLENRESTFAPATLSMDGQRVFKFAAEAMTNAVLRTLERADLDLDDIACIVAHQANERIIKYAAKKLSCPLGKFQLSIAHTGNTSAASIPMALCDAYRSGRISRGDRIILVGFGGGFTSGAVLYEA